MPNKRLPVPCCPLGLFLLSSSSLSFHVVAARVILDGLPQVFVIATLPFSCRRDLESRIVNGFNSTARLVAL